MIFANRRQRMLWAAGCPVRPRLPQQAQSGQERPADDLALFPESGHTQSLVTFRGSAV